MDGTGATRDAGIIELPVPRPSAPPAFHLLAKPSGSTCNIDCTYCFFLSKEALYPDERSRMSDATLETYLRQLLEAHTAPEVTVAWQGGEPTLLGRQFYERAMALVEQFRRPNQTVQHTFQTNGILLDDQWCRFFKKHGVLVGLSMDGPKELHDRYRLDRRGEGTFDKVLSAWRLLQRHGIDVNILCTVNAANEAHGREVYTFFRDVLGATWMQFIPIVERATPDTIELANQGWSNDPKRRRILYVQDGNLTTDRSVSPMGYGTFLNEIFDEWVHRDVGTVFVQLFDVTLEAFFGRHLLCIHAPTCGAGPALEFNGDVYSCDHYVEPGYRLGNIHETHLVELIAKPEQRQFGLAKQETLTAQCRSCRVRPFCNGGCPKDRFALSKDGEPGQNYMCPGLEAFFEHTGPHFSTMAQLYSKGYPPSDIMRLLAAPPPNPATSH